jgi:LysM repeat protein
VDCYSCNQPAINACKRCAKPYCEEHGNTAYCAECLRPSSALPSFNLYRGALLVMLVGTAVAVLLILRPPGESTGASPVVVGRSTPTATAASGTPQPTVAAATPGTTDTSIPGTPGADETPNATPGAGGTPAATASAATPGATESPFNEHVVVPGDTLLGIAEANLAPGDDLVAFAQAIASLNGLDYNNPNLTIGQTLLLPKPKP